MSWSPPRFSSSALRERMSALVEGQSLSTGVADALEVPDARLPGRGWVVVSLLEDPGIVCVTTLRDGAALAARVPDLVALHGQSWFDAADLAPETAAAAARVDAVMGVESIAEIAERYRVAEAEITPHEVSILSEEGLPEEVLGLTVCFRYAG